MMNAILAFAERYKAIPVIASASLSFGYIAWKTHGDVTDGDGSQYILEEQKLMAQHHRRPTEHYVTYHSIKIEGRTQKINKGRLVEVFKMNSDVTRDKQAVRMTWRDTAAFRNANGELIERSSPCQQSYPEPGLPTVDCKGTPSDGWYQHQWWRGDMAKKEKRSWEPWTYTQKTIPPGASAVQICGFYDIRVYKGFLGEVDKIMNVCTRWYDLKDIPEVAE